MSLLRFGLVVQILGGVLYGDTVALHLMPASQLVSAGQSVFTDVRITGLGTPPSVGAFDLAVSYDAGLLSFAAVSFSPLLGDVSLSEALTGFSLSPGIVEFAEVSLLTPAQLDALQSPNFMLTTLSFQALESGTATFSFASGVVDDAFGDKLTEIPEPRTLHFLGSALAGWLVLAGRRRASGLLRR